MKILAKPAFKNQKDNPYNFLLYSAMEEASANEIIIEEFSVRKALLKKFEIFHIHWPEYYTSLSSLWCAYTKTFLLILIVCTLKIKKTKILWTFHNAKPHDTKHKNLEKIFYLFFSSLVDGIIYMSNTSRDLSYHLYPKLKEKPFIVTLHGTYSKYYPNIISKASARSLLKIEDNKKVILCFGQIRPYKGIDEIIHVFKKMKNNNITLLIVGKSANLEYFKDVEKITKNCSDIVLINNFIKEEDLQIYFKSADLVIANYTEILNSGVAILALSFNKDMLIPKSPQMIELKNTLKTEKIHLFEKPLSSNSIDAALLEITKTKENYYAALDWKFIAESTYAFYKKVIS